MSLITGDTFDVAIRDVSVPRNRILATTPERINEMKKALEKNRVLLNPILIRTADGNSYRVVAGATRFEAAKALGWSNIRATLIHGSVSELSLAEVEENLKRNNLSDTERKRLRDEEIRLRAELQKEEDTKAANERKAQASQQSHKAKPPAAPKKNPGRPEGGISKVARDSGVPRTTARRAIKNDGGVSGHCGQKLPRSKTSGIPKDRERLIKATHALRKLIGDETIDNEHKQFWKEHCWPLLTKDVAAL
jgi:ParB/RepB/Spo0J family partition protein